MVRPRLRGPRRPISGEERQDKRSDWRTTATTLAGIVSVLLVAAGLFYTNEANRNQQQLGLDQQKLALQGQVADRFTAAIGQLGQEDEKRQDKLSIRLGGIYGLQRLMIDSPPDEPAVVQVLCAFVRTHARRPTRLPKKVPPSPADVRAAVAVLGGPPYPGDLHALDFSGTLLGLDHASLSGAHLQHASLTGADLTGADLTGAYLPFADLTGADLTGADLSGALLDVKRRPGQISGPEFAFANLNFADLTGANLTGANLGGAYLQGAKLTGANLTGADLSGVDLRGPVGLTSEQVASARVAKTTRLPAGLVRPSPAPSR
jgi:hypothetical protein